MRKSSAGFAAAYIVISVFIIGTVIGAYLFGKNSVAPETVKTQEKAVQTTPSPTPSPSSSSNEAETATWKTYTSPEYNPFFTNEKAKQFQQRRKIQPDMYGSAENEKLIQFSIKYPSDWKQGYDEKGLNSEKDTHGSGFTFIKNNLEIRIARFYAPGGNSCDLANYGSNFKDIKTNFTTLRRIIEFENTEFIPKDYVRYVLCEKEGDDISSNTTIGMINFTLPQNYKPEDLELMDKIISTLQKLNN